MNGEKVQVVGFLNAGLGQGEAARLVLDALREVEVEVVPHVCNLGGVNALEHVKPEGGAVENIGKDCPVSIVCLNPEHLNSFAERVGEGYFQERRIVGYWFWETENIPESAVRCFDYVDEVWVATDFLKQAFEKRTELPVRVFPNAIQVEKLQEAKVPERFNFGSRFVYLFSFDFNSSVRRKNPRGVCQAFVKAFPEEKEGGPLLIIKSIHWKNRGLDFLRLYSEFKHRSDILFLKEFLPVEERDGLTARANCYVSLHRSEGLGLTMMEAMALGKPCIATNYSGNEDFMTEENSYLIPWKRVKVGEGCLHYPAEDEWAEPNIEKAAEAMRDVFENQEKAKERGARGMKDIAENNSLLNSGRILKEHITALLEKPIRPKDKLKEKEPLPKKVTQHTLASQELKNLKEARKKLKKQIKETKMPRHMKPLFNQLLALEESNQRLISLVLKSVKEKEVGIYQRLEDSFLEKTTFDEVMEVLFLSNE